MDKRVASADEAIADVGDGAVILMGGFGVCGLPENLIRALRDKGVKNLTLASNNAGLDDQGVGLLLNNGQVKKMILSYGGECKAFEEMTLGGTLEVEWTPQGTLAERIRAAGAGIGGFFTPTGYGTVVAEGKETREIDGKNFVFEKPLHANFAFVKAWKADPMGNLVFRRTARNFNQVMSTAAKTVIAEAEEIVETGGLHPDQIHTPGAFVSRVLKGEAYKKPIEKRTVRAKSEAAL
ncbi:MAG: succinyl-CoA--3-ketoacid-CoA transferase [Elusimicrobia bacterium CG1_02_63_36]|nr:MAG: succinyl-CoA--3-ketoacid-CoA transferase [Elusimicrobia bacterium CG1_02_63_36]PJB23213.1 MAG: succinyl-CoA--3-ketoacid-CoA transferase [Elusimicrobia bacterium CG_4_9_14_3_um_filter_62_55]